MKKIAAIIEARMASTRLPGKTMMEIMGKPMLELMIERIKRAVEIDEVIVATTTNKEDSVIEGLTKRLSVKCFSGSSEDVLDRVLKAAQKNEVDIIVELTGDCPLIEPEVIDILVKIYKRNKYDFVANTIVQTYPRGLDVKVFSTEVLDEVARTTNDPADRENVSLYIYEHPEKYSLFNYEARGRYRHPDLRLTVDTKEDFELIKNIYEELYPKNPAFTYSDVLDLLDRKPERAKINVHIKQKPVR